MPIIFAQAILFLPTIFTGFTGEGWARYFTDHTNGVYMIVYSILVIAFTFLYTALIFNPKQMADDLKRNNGFIPGIKPGQPTADYIGTIMDFSNGFRYVSGLLNLLRRNIPADHGRGDPRHAAADRNPVAHASVRWIDEQRPYPGQTDRSIRHVIKNEFF